jgi:spermidine/putrescine-binding protein
MSTKSRKGLWACAAVAVAGLTFGNVARAEEPLLVFDWAGYEDPNFHQAYVEKHGASPSYAFFGDDDEGFQKVRAGFTPDLAHPCMTTLSKWHEAGLIDPIDTSRIAAWDDLLPALKAVPGIVQDGKVWMVPFDWGNAMLMVRTDEVPEADRTLDIFTNPKYRGKVAISSLVDDAFALALLKLGHDSFDDLKDPATLAAASAYLAEVRDNQRLYWTDPTELNQAIASGEIVAAWAWNQSVATLQGEGVPVAAVTGDGAGVSTWVCGYVDVAGGPAPADLAYDYLNALLEPRAGEYLLESWGYGHSNAEAFTAADKAAIARFGFDDPAGLMASSLFQANIGVDLHQKLADEFEKIKSGF